jgi:DNA repair protein SbcD/Mre11
MSKVAILGDPHLGKGTGIGKTGIGSNLNSRVADQLNLLDWTLDQAIDQGAEHIIITGDVFEDPRPHPTLITLFVSWLKKCQAYSVHVHVILGNHDMLRSGFIYSSPLDIISEVEMDGIDIYKNIDSIFIDTTAFTFIPFRDRKSLGAATQQDALNIMQETLAYELASLPATYKKVVVGHLVIEGSIPVGDEIDDITNELFCPVKMFEGYDYVWMGHVHKPQIMNKKNPYVAHIGSMDVSNFGETDQKKYIVILETDSDKEFHIEYLPTRALKKISITIPKETVDTTKYVLSQLKNLKLGKSIVKVEIALDAPELKSVNKGTIEKFLTEHGVFNISGISESKKVVLVKKDNTNVLNTKMDVASAIYKYSELYIDKSFQVEFANLAMEIYNSFKSEAKE